MVGAGASQKDERECLGECEDILLKSYPAGMKPRNIDGEILHELSVGCVL